MGGGGQPALDAGCDVSADMIEACRVKAVVAGHASYLAVLALHELGMPRRYRTVFVVGAFGLGSTRQRDQEALVRWPAGRRGDLPEAARPPKSRRLAFDGAVYGLSTRLIDVNPLEQTVRMALHAERWRDGELEAQEDHCLDMWCLLPQRSVVDAAPRSAAAIRCCLCRRGRS